MAYPLATREEAKKQWLLGHSLRTIAKNLNIKHWQTIQDWKDKYNWQQEKKLTQQQTAEQTRQKVAKTLSDLNKEHEKIARAIITENLRYIIGGEKDGRTIKALKPKSQGEAVRNVEAGIKIERLIKDQPTERIHVIEKVLQYYEDIGGVDA